MFNHPKEFKRVCIVSSVAFSILSCFCKWITPIEKILDLAIDLTEKEMQTARSQFDEAVEYAIKMTYYNDKISNTQRQILEELSLEEIESYDFREAIKRTETYRIMYCTNADANEILSIFEKFLLKQVIKKPLLNKLYVMNAQCITLKKLEQINDLLLGYGEDLNQVKNDIFNLTKRAIEGKRIYLNCFNSIVYTMVAMLIFLSLGIITSHHYSGLIVLSAIISCIISDFLMVFVRIDENILIAVVLTISCFWILIWSIDMGNTYFIFTTISLIIGKCASLLLKKFYAW